MRRWSIEHEHGHVRNLEMSNPAIQVRCATGQLALHAPGPGTGEACAWGRRPWVPAGDKSQVPGIADSGTGLSQLALF